MVQRTRQQNIPHTAVTQAKIIKASTGAVTSSFSGSRSFNDIKTFVDEVTPGFFEKVHKGILLPMNPAACTESRIDILDGAWGYNSIYQGKISNTYVHTGASVLGSRSYSSPFSFQSPSFIDFSEHDVSALYTDALAKAKTHAMDVMTFLAEWHKTKEMVTKVGGRLIERANTIVKAKKLYTIKDRKAFVSAFSDSWLEYRYGWRILAFEIEDAMALADKLMNGAYLRWRKRSDGIHVNKLTDTNNIVSTYYWSGGVTSGPIANARMKIRESHDVQCRVGVLMESLMRTYATIDPLLTAWELVPYSFVLDWFINVNQFLAAASPFCDVDLKQSYKRTNYVRRLTVEHGPRDAWTPIGSTTRYEPFGTPSLLTAESSSWIREPLSLTEARLTLDYQNDFDRWKALDSLALLWGRLSTLRRITKL